MGPFQFSLEMGSSTPVAGYTLETELNARFALRGSSTDRDMVVQASAMNRIGGTPLSGSGIT
jgi:hypothetical protein